MIVAVVVRAVARGLAFAIVAATVTTAAAAQRSDSTASIVGIVRDSARGVPLAFGVVTVTSATPQIQRFASDSGRFELPHLHAGPIALRVRHLGFAPREIQLTLEPGERRSIVVDLARIVVTLPIVAVQASRACTGPGIPRAADDSAFAAVFDQLRENADQFRLLATEYPFVSSLDRNIVAELRDGSLESELRDTIVMRSDRFWPYRPGQVITRSPDVRAGSEYVMHIPTLDVIADSLFLKAHCFTNGGRVDVDGAPRLQVDFQAAASITAPDVDGSMYLDPATFQIRSSVVRLSRQPRQFPQIDSLEVTTDFDEVRPSLSVITSIRSRTRVNTPGRSIAARATIEFQRLVALTFRAEPPGGSTPGTPGQPPARKASREIVAVDSASGLALANVEIHDPVSDSTTRTGADGRATFTFVADSGGIVTVRRVGYAMREVRVPASSIDANAIRVTLSRAVALPAVVARDSMRRYLSPALNGFEERRRLGLGGYFISDSILRKEENRRLGDVMRGHAPGVMIAEGPHLANYLLKSPRCSSGGPPQVYLDGVPLSALPVSANPPQPGRPPTSRDQAAAFPPFDLSQFNVSDLAGVEYYPDGTMLPEEFNHTSERCGALLLWTRER